MIYKSELIMLLQADVRDARGRRELESRMLAIAGEFTCYVLFMWQL